MTENNNQYPHLTTKDKQLCINLAQQTLTTNKVTQTDITTVTQQLGRYPRGIIGIGARCTRCQTPLVVITRPLINGTLPFPTTCYLTSREATKAVSGLESTGVMTQLTAQLADTTDHANHLREQYYRAHEMYLFFRFLLAEHLGDSEEHIASISAGGMPTRVKCLHALVAQSLVFGSGVNPVGDWALTQIKDSFDPHICRCSIHLTDNQKG